MFIYDKIIYKWFKVSIVVNFALVMFTAQCCPSRLEFTEELGDMECAK